MVTSLTRRAGCFRRPVTLTNIQTSRVTTVQTEARETTCDGDRADIKWRSS